MRPIYREDVEAQLQLSGRSRYRDVSRIEAGQPDRNAYINLLVEDCAAAFEERCRVSLITRSYALELERWPDAEDWPDDPASVRLRRCIAPGQSRLRLPRPPLARVSSLELVNADASTDTVPATDYRRAADSLYPVGDWPTLEDGQLIRVNFEAGYGLAPSNIPHDIRRALRHLVCHDYAQREAMQAPADTFGRLMEEPAARETRLPPRPFVASVYNRHEQRWSI